MRACMYVLTVLVCVHACMHVYVTIFASIRVPS